MKLAHRNGPVVVAALLLLEMALLLWWFSPEFVGRVFAHLFGGGVFRHTRIITGGALDEPSLHKGFFLFGLFSLLVAPGVFATHWLGDWNNQAVRATFRTLSWPLFLLPFSLLTITSVELLRYIGAMGITPMRLAGLACAVLSYAVLFGALYAMWRPPRPSIQNR